MIKLSVVIPVLNEDKNIVLLITKLKEVLSKTGLVFEIILIDGGSTDQTVRAAKAAGIEIIRQEGSGYGKALLQGLAITRGELVVTMDADFSHPPEFILTMLKYAGEADIIVASRYIGGSRSRTGLMRFIVSRLLCLLFNHGLSIPVSDITSGFRVYNREVIADINILSREFEVQVELILRAYANGWSIKEIPFNYEPRRHGKSHISDKIFRLIKGYLTVFWRVWKIRNSLLFADYDEQAYYSSNILQKYWQRARYSIIMSFIKQDGPLVDLGCGSSRIIQSLPQAVALDLSLGKLRYIRKYNKYIVNASIGRLPFKDGAFSCIVCSQVIEHTREENIFKEISRILKPDGLLILGTPDYGQWQWRVIEFLYGVFKSGGYKDKHVKRYTDYSLKEILPKYGLRIEAQEYICSSELIIKARKVIY